MEFRASESSVLLDLLIQNAYYLLLSPIFAVVECSDLGSSEKAEFHDMTDGTSCVELRTAKY